MAFEDFTKTGWTIRCVHGGSQEAESHKITIAGSAADVTVTCEDSSHEYKNGVYDPNKDQIVGPGYAIYRTITCSPSPVIGDTGSWTADDHLPWDEKE
jgi:hypothetical protein